VSLTRYLNQIRQGTPINYPAFLKLLPQAVARRQAEVFATEKVAANRWQVTCLDEAVLAELESLAATPDSRVAAARQGNSHRHITDATFLLVYHEGLPDARPDVVCLSPGRCLQGFTGKATALVVENEHNFAHAGAMLAFASACLGRDLGFASTDVVLGGGNRITGALAVDWLGQYDQVLCAFDYDLGGLRMFDSLSRRLGAKAVFLQPQAWAPWHEAFRMSPESTARYLQAIELAATLGFDNLADTFRQTGHFMEQEMVLEQASLEQKNGQ